MTDVDKSRRSVAEWLDSCQTRFKNMYDADLDKNGYPAFKKAMDHFNEKGYFTVGEIAYLFHRTSPYGVYPKYNKHRGYNKIHGEMIECPIKDLVDSNLVNWRTGANGVMPQHLANAIRSETSWEYRMGNLRPQRNTTFGDLFGAK